MIYARTVVEHKDQLTRPGFRYLATLRELQGRTIDMVHVAEKDTEELMAHLVALVSSLTAQLSGQCRAKCTTAHIVQELQGESKHESR